MAELLAFLSKNDIKREVLLKFGQYINNEQYDTDGLKADIESVGKTCKNKQLTEVIKEFIKATAGYLVFVC